MPAMQEQDSRDAYVGWSGPGLMAMIHDTVDARNLRPQTLDQGLTEALSDWEASGAIVATLDQLIAWIVDLNNNHRVS